MKTRLLQTLAISAILSAGAASAQEDPFRIAFLAASSQNGFNQATYAGITERAEELGVEVEIFDGEFNPVVQFNQVEDLTASKRFDAIILQPNDTVGIAPAVAEAIEAGILVSTTLFPIGPDLTTMEPQVPGLTTTVASDPAIGAKAQAQAVIDFCADKDPCKIVIMMGQLIFPFDNLRYQTFLEELKDEANIKILATGEGNYDPNASLNAMQDILQANPEVDAVLSNNDQQLIGIELALMDAGINVEDVYLIGGGLNQITVAGIREGRFDATMLMLPKSIGTAALQAMYDALSGKEVPTWIDADKLQDIPLIVDRQWLDAHPDFVAAWEG